MELRFDTLQLAVPLLGFFHRYTWGYVHLHRRGKDSRCWHPIEAEGFKGTFPVRALRSFHLWSQPQREWFLVQLMEDSYASVNTLYNAYERPNPPSKYYHRLNAAMVDFDYGRNMTGPSDAEAIATVDELVAEEVLPPVSVIEQTGRGLHVYWMLGETEADWEQRLGAYLYQRDQGQLEGYPRLPYAKPVEIKRHRPADMGDMDTWLEQHLDHTRWPPYALRGNGFRLEEINRQIANRVWQHAPALKPDSAGVTTHMRIPGSVNSKSGTGVVHTVRLSDGMSIPATYSLDELRQFFDLDQPRRARKRKKKAAKSPEAERGAALRQARCAWLWDELQRIRQHRGGFKEGLRKRACFLAAIILRGLGMPDAEIEREISDLAKSCHPPLEDRDATDALKGAGGKYRLPSNVTLANSLEVTAAEVQELGLKKIDPEYEYRPGAGTAKARREGRRARLLEIADDEGVPLPLSLVELSEELGAHPNTIRKDLQDLGLSTLGQAGN